MPGTRRVSVAQLEEMVGFMEEHREVARGQTLDTPQAKAAVRQQWEQLAARLNSMMGHVKTGAQWRDYWRDMKYRVKKKVGEQEVHRRGTGGGPPSTEVLTPVEERIYTLLGRQAVLGDEEVRIPFGLEEDMPSPSCPPSPCVEIEIVSLDNEPPLAPLMPPPAPLMPPPAPLMPPAAPLFPPAPWPSTSRAAPVLPPAPINPPPAPRPSTSRASPIEVVIEHPYAGESPAAAKRKRRADGTASASNPTEIPQPRWAWDAEQSRLRLDERRLSVEERMLDLFQTFFGEIIALLREIAAALRQRADSN